jgi:hypothetical protein
VTNIIHFVLSLGLAVETGRGMTVSGMPTPSKTPKYIRRQTDAHHGASWAVALQRRGKAYQRQFGDREYGGCDEAHAAAESYLRSLLKILPKRSRVRKKYVTNKSGMAGVIRTWEVTRTGARNSYYKAYWPKLGEPGKATSRKFSISKYGREGAFARAVAARRTGVDDAGNESPL